MDGAADNFSCQKCSGAGFRSLTEEEYNTPGAVAISFGPIFGPEGQVGVATCHCECEIGRIKLAQFKRIWHEFLLGCESEVG